MRTGTRCVARIAYAPVNFFSLSKFTKLRTNSAHCSVLREVGLYNAVNVAIPAAVSVFPGENYEAPRSWAERAYHKLIYYNTVDKGGHYVCQVR